MWPQLTTNQSLTHSSTVGVTTTNAADRPSGVISQYLRSSYGATGPLLPAPQALYYRRQRRSDLGHHFALSTRNDSSQRAKSASTWARVSSLNSLGRS